MVTASAVITAHAPGDWGEFVALAVISVAGLALSWRAAGPNYAIISTLVGLATFVVIGNIAIPAAAMLVAAALFARAHYLRRPAIAAPGHLAPEVALVLGGMAVYITARYVVERGGGAPFTNGEAIVSFERSLRLYVEPNLQSLMLRSDAAARVVNWTYSFAFLAIVAAAMFWLWAVDRANYTLLRNSLGLSVILAIPTIALLPVAPPRLLHDSGVIDSIAVFGREHAFANEYAAVPSLHVGWMAATGAALGRSIGGRRGIAVAVALTALMLLTVMATGNHFWVDGAVGAAYALGALFMLAYWPALSAGAPRTARATAEGLTRGADLTWAVVTGRPRALFSTIALGGLLFYLLGEEHLHPGFTDYWGYLVGQVAVFLILLVGAEIIFAREGGLSWWTHIIAVACAYADVLGTDGNLYAQIDEYDKITHFAGVAAITAGVYDCLRALNRRGTISWTATDRLTFAVAVGIAIGVGWEVYEVLGDRVFNTTRVNSRFDTINDIISDSAGAIILAALLWFGEVRAGSAWRSAPARDFPAFEDEAGPRG